MRHVPKSHFETSKTRNFPIYSKEAYNGGHYHEQQQQYQRRLDQQQCIDRNPVRVLDKAVSGFELRHVPSSHFTTSQKSQFKEFTRDQVEKAKPVAAQQTRDSNNGNEFYNNDNNNNDNENKFFVRMRHVPADHFRTSTKDQFPVYDSKVYLNNHSSASRFRAEGNSNFHQNINNNDDDENNNNKKNKKNKNRNFVSSSAAGGMMGTNKNTKHRTSSKHRKNIEDDDDTRSTRSSSASSSRSSSSASSIRSSSSSFRSSSRCSSSSSNNRQKQQQQLDKDNSNKFIPGYCPRHVKDPNHWMSATKSQFPVYDVRKIIQEQQQQQQQQDDAEQGKSTTGRAQYGHQLRHVLKSHFQTMTHSQFPVYDVAKLKREEISNNSRSHEYGNNNNNNKQEPIRGYQPRHAPPEHWVTSTKSQFERTKLQTK